MQKVLSIFGEERKNKKAILRPYKKEHEAFLESIFYDDVLNHMELVLEKGQNKFSAYTEYLEKDGTTTNKITFSCFDENNILVGITQLKYIDYFNKKCEMGGTWYGKTYQGSGINLACKQVIFNFVFDVLGFRRIQFSIDVDNVSSIKSMIKIGAKQEGLFRNNWVDENGNSRDDLYFSITNQDWAELKNTTYKDF